MFDADTGERGFYVFDEKGKVILEKQGEYSYRCGENHFAELMFDGEAGNGRYKQIGLYDEITGRELVPIRYDYVCVWRKNDGNILSVGVPDLMDCEKGIDYFEYDFRGGSQVAHEQNSYPTGAEICKKNYDDCGINIWVLKDKLEALGYEEIELCCI